MEISRQKPYILWYTDEAPLGNEEAAEQIDNPDDGWERWSLPIGNGYIGANVFGRKGVERILVSENSLCNPYTHGQGGLNCLADIRLYLHHEDCTDFVRWLDISEAVAGVRYIQADVTYTRRVFASYPDRVLAVRLESSRPGTLEFELEVRLPYIKPYLYETGDGMGKTGAVHTSQKRITFAGEMAYYRIAYEGQLSIDTDGRVEEAGDGRLAVRQATYAVVLMAAATNYRMEARVFTEPEPAKKLVPYPHPHELVTNLLDRALEKGYDALLAAHLRDYQALFGRVKFSISDEVCSLPTAEMLEEYRRGIPHPYLEELYFQYGRYLLIASSRSGGYPANLQGVWNKYDHTPWSSGYWHNINVQMNYWPAFCTNLAETFEPYAAYFRAYLPLAQQHADAFIRQVFPERLASPGNNGWTIGTGAWLYTITGAELPDNGHSGPGTGGLTAKLFWDYYAFTQDRDVLKNVTYPALEGMATFLSKNLEKQDNVYLVTYSASPEQIHNGTYYHTKGCAFDQQMVYETYHDLLEAAALLHTESDTVRTAREQIGHLEPVLIGASGQIKEYREESRYGEIGEYHHRHISQLVGLYPGSCIGTAHPEALQAAIVTLTERGDFTTGWATAHRLNAWARTHRGNRTYLLLRSLLTRCTFPNLWDAHPPFQIDGNFGGTAGIAEMLLQSHEGYIEVVPALPDSWKTGHFKGLVARGNFVVNAWWEDGRVIRLEILSRAGRPCRIRFSGSVEDGQGRPVPADCADGMLIFETRPEEIYILRPQERVLYDDRSA